MKLFEFDRTVTDAESVAIEAETFEEAWEILNDPETSLEYKAQPIESGPWHTCTMWQDGKTRWSNNGEDIPIPGEPEEGLAQSPAVPPDYLKAAAMLRFLWESGSIASHCAEADAIVDFLPEFLAKLPTTA